ncbi:hypothetical protein ACFOE1_18030 [Agromyces mediolanus]|uniref:Uncharacterized protein n=1 Tax=Agromyces mediolanus TaxID=41986 RepID=A0A918FGC5_AGRME|nr:hypothetical protein [Agromyces mediolanus]GGR35918.1 hypothetical protein GCM10010196_32440 [Agromyces mediolanus]GLJ73075.1 hypothetical protein GCM10017583_23310 [Agromyces mediolanus]
MAEEPIEPALDLAIERALEAASLRSGDALSGVTASVTEPPELSAAENGDAGGDAD